MISKREPACGCTALCYSKEVRIAVVMVILLAFGGPLHHPLIFFFCNLWYETVSDGISHLYCCLNSFVVSVETYGRCQGNFPFVNRLKFRSR